MQTTYKKWAYIAATTYAVIIGLSFLFVKLTVNTAHPIDVLSHRFTLSLLAVTIPIAAGWIKVRLTLRDVLRILPLGLLSPTLFFAFQAFGLLTSTSTEAGIIQAMAPVFTLILASYFLKERTTLTQKLFLLMSVAGVIYIFAMKGASLSLGNFTGIALLLCSALSFAGYGVLARPLTRRYKPMELTWITLMVGCVGFSAASMVYHGFTGSFADYFAPLGNASYIGALAYLAILSTMGTTLLSSFALTHLEASRMSVFGNISTLISILAGALLLNEPVHSYHLIGAVFIIAGVLGTNYGGKKNASLSASATETGKRS